MQRELLDVDLIIDLYRELLDSDLIIDYQIL